MTQVTGRMFVVSASMKTDKKGSPLMVGFLVEANEDQTYPSRNFETGMPFFVFGNYAEHAYAGFQQGKRLWELRDASLQCRQRNYVTTNGTPVKVGVGQIVVHSADWYEIPQRHQEIAEAPETEISIFASEEVITGNAALTTIGEHLELGKGKKARKPRQS